MKPPLDPIDRELLDFLCASAHHRVRVVRIKAPRVASLRRLRLVGLVGWDDYLPSGSALLAWIERERTKSEAAPQACVAEEPPAPEAAGPKGGGDARNAAPPPQVERAKRFEKKRDERDTRGTSGAHGRGRERAPEGGLANGPIQQRKRRTPDTAASTHAVPEAEGPNPSVEPSLVAPKAVESAVEPVNPVPVRPALEEPKPVDIKVNAPRDPTSAPPPSYSPEKRSFLSASQKSMRTNRKAAEAFLDSGKTSNDAPGVSLRIEARKVEIQRAEDARLADPLEQAKTIIRRAGWVCFSAVISGGPAGHFYIGSRLVTEAELMARAEQLERRRAG